MLNGATKPAVSRAVGIPRALAQARPGLFRHGRSSLAAASWPDAFAGLFRGGRGGSVSGGLSPAPATVVAAMGLLAALALAGCGVAPMTEEACLNLDLAAMGEEHGRDGRAPVSLYRYEQACAAHGLVPDTDAYARAHRRGLAAYRTRYCTLENGYERGSRGVGDLRGCPAGGFRGFRYGYDLGLAVNDVNGRAAVWDRSVTSWRLEVQSLSRQIMQAEMWAGTGFLHTEEEQERKRRELRNLRDRRDDLADKIEESAAALREAIGRYRQFASNPIRHSPDFPYKSQLMSVDLKILRLNTDMQMELQQLRFAL